MWRSEPILSGDRGGRGSLVVSGERVYGLTAVQAGPALLEEVFCLDAGNGKTLWRSRLSDSDAPETGSSTPAIAGGRLYLAASGSKVHCLDARSGDRVWEASLPRPMKKPVASSVAVARGVAALLAEVLTGFDAGTGKVLWTQEKIQGHESSPAVWKADGGDYLIVNTPRETHCVDPAGGQVLWSVPGGGKSTPVVAREYGGDFLVDMSESRRNGLSAHRLTREGPRKLWSLEAFDRASSPVVFDGHVYAIAGGGNGHGARILCVHLDTGRVAWDETIDFAEVSSPVVADGKMIAVCGTVLWLLDATPEKYSVLSQANHGITLCTSPALAGGRLYLRQAEAVACYDLRFSP